MSEETVERSIGRLEGKLQELSAQVERERITTKDAFDALMSRFELLAGTMSEIRAAQERTKGGWAMLTVLASVAASLGAAVSWAAKHLTLQ